MRISLRQLVVTTHSQESPAYAAHGPATNVASRFRVSSVGLGDVLFGEAMPLPTDATVVTEFEEQTRLRPDRRALIYGETVVSYQELERRAAELLGGARETNLST